MDDFLIIIFAVFCIVFLGVIVAVLEHFKRQFDRQKAAIAVLGRGLVMMYSKRGVEEETK